MPGIGTLVNAAAVILGGIIGMLLNKGISEKISSAITKAVGLAVIFVGISGTLEKMIHIEKGNLVATGAIVILLSLVIGTVIGEWIGIEALFERLGSFLKKTFTNGRDTQFVEGFLTATITICVGAMAVVGSIQDGLMGEPGILYTKAVIDGIFLMVLSATYGKGTIFSAIPLLVFQGGITFFAYLLQTSLSVAVVDNIAMTGSVLIFCLGCNMVFQCGLRVANMLPSLVVAVICGML